MPKLEPDSRYFARPPRWPSILLPVAQRAADHPHVGREHGAEIPRGELDHRDSASDRTTAS